MIYDIVKASDKLGIGEASLRNHINSFYRDFQKSLPGIDGAIESSNSEKIYFEFHKLKSTFRMISAHKAEDICRLCCDKSIEKQPYEYAKALDEIVQYFESLHSQINGRDS